MRSVAWRMGHDCSLVLPEPYADDPGRACRDADAVSKSKDGHACGIHSDSAVAGHEQQSAHSQQQAGDHRLAVAELQQQRAGDKCTDHTGDAFQASQKCKCTSGDPQAFGHRDRKQGLQIVVGSAADDQLNQHHRHDDPIIMFFNKPHGLLLQILP